MLENKYDFMILFDVENGNPNGDPDADNMPRIDPETNLGIVTDVCLKRKVRNYVDMACEAGTGYDIYIQEKEPLKLVDIEAYKYIKNDLKKKVEVVPNGEIKKGKKIDYLCKFDPKEHAKAELDLDVLNFMCKNFFDIRTFGAVMTTHVENNFNAGQVRGPIQFSFARSINPIFPQNIAITRGAVATEKDFNDKGSNTMGRKHIVPYGLYKAEGYISAPLAKKTGFSEKDLELLWESLINMFEHDRAAARGKMVVRELIVFKHDSEIGSAPSHKLFELIKADKIGEKPARSYRDYKVIVPKQSDMPTGVTVTSMV